MSLVSRFGYAVSAVALFIAILVVGVTARYELVFERETRVNTALQTVIAHPELPALVYGRDRELVGTVLKRMLSDDAVLFALVYDGVGEKLALESFQELREGSREGLLEGPRERSREGPRDESPDQTLNPNVPSITLLREGKSPLELSAYTQSASAAGIADRLDGFTLPFSTQKIDYAFIPIVTPVNPLQETMTVEEVLISQAEGATARSRYVVGHVGVALNRGVLWEHAMPRILPTAFVCLFAVMATALITQFFGRRFFGSLIRLSEKAQQAASGDVDLDTRFSAEGEGRHIAALLNATFTELKRYRATVNVDRQLLNLKVSAQGSRLSELDQELDVAKEEVARTREDLHRMAYFDSLTGLPNRRLFTEQLHLILRMCERDDNQFALMFVDLDNFKRINDSLGHSVGDLLLREVSIRLANCTRTSDLLGHFSSAHLGVEVSRLGGDEFTIVATNLREESEAAVVAERALKALNEPIFIDAHELVITPSIGIAIGPQDGMDVESLLRAADTAMYASKEDGKNKFTFYNDAMKTTDVLRLRLESDLRSAIERGELKLYYQPMVSLKTGTIVGAEALLRWHHPEKEVLGPGTFLPLAEELGMSVELGEWTFREACRMVNELEMERCALKKISVNISPLAVSRTFVNRVKQIMAETAVDPSQLELEITEDVIMGTDVASIDCLEQLKRLGLRLSIDDFGTGYSSLSYLSHFPLDTLKIDRSFVQDYSKSRNNESLVEAIAAMATKLQLGVVAEGVETADQLRFLHGLGVDVIQGFLFSPPVTAQRLPFLLDHGYFRAKIEQAFLAGTVAIGIDPA
ncbi:MAG: EAL domain-containing protein [Pseudomonadota bacterium]